LAAANTSLAIGSLERLNQLVTDPLMIPLSMVVGYELGNRLSGSVTYRFHNARVAVNAKNAVAPCTLFVRTAEQEFPLRDDEFLRSNSTQAPLRTDRARSSGSPNGF
jgi:hypothetical protein